VSQDEIPVATDLELSITIGNESLPDAKLRPAPRRDEANDPPQLRGGNKRSRSVDSPLDIVHFRVVRSNCLNLI